MRLTRRADRGGKGEAHSGAGPAAFVTAAFIGPGTLLMCTRAGAGFGYSLLWAVLFSVIATVVLQEMAGRASLATGTPLAGQIAACFANPFLKAASALLVIGAIAFGCAAYQSGNLSGGGAGFEILFPGLTSEWHFAAGALGVGAGLLLFFSGYVWVERVLKLTVLVMSLSFAASALCTGPRLFSIVKGLLIPSLPDGSAMAALGLIGTTVVPYNLFLYSRVVQERFRGTDDLPGMRRDLYLFIAIGGTVSGLIAITAANVLGGSGGGPTFVGDPTLVEMPVLLEPVLGKWARALFGAGLFAAGFSSALTAPLAGAYVVAGIFNASTERKGLVFRATWMAILGAGVFFSVKPDLRPEEIIRVAQLANGLLLPLVVCFLLVAVNAKGMGVHRNSAARNVAGAVIALVTLALGVKMILAGLGW
jgi:manganese transport protein